MILQEKQPDQADYCVALIGNPNVGKSTLFNRLTGLRQHTGNWPGKTVELAEGTYRFNEQRFRIVDLPGTYSLLSRSKEETVTTQYLQQAAVDCILVICDGTCLERNLILVLQLLALRRKLLVCVNLLDEVRRRHITLDLARLSELLGVPVVGVCTADGTGVSQLQWKIGQLCAAPAPGSEPESGTALQEAPQQAARDYARQAAEIASQVEQRAESSAAGRAERVLDRLFLHRATGVPLLLLLLFGILWLTIEGANYPSELLQHLFDRAGAFLRMLMASWPAFWQGILLDGLYWTVARVVAVMLPPMAIFFPLFTLLEDVGLLPRIAFLLDGPMYRSGTEGKMALTMCMGLGCNAAGVTGCKIITSDREREIAIITNALVPCNGRFPALILFAGMILAGTGLSFGRAGLLLVFLLLATAMTLLCARWLSRTVLRREQTSFLLELPPYRKPRVLQVIVRSVLDRTLFVLGRAVAIAAPAGVLIWLLANWRISGDQTVLATVASALDPVGLLLGMNGAVLLGFVLGLPANELVLPVTLLILSGQGTLAGAQSTAEITSLLYSFGWTWKTALCASVFVLFHWPCGTTIATIWRETRRLRTVLLSVAVPTAVGVTLCVLLRLILQFF